MHPDFSLVLQKCASNLSLKHKQPILFSAYVNCKNSSGRSSGSDMSSSPASTAEMSNNSQDDTEDLVRIVSDEEEEEEECHRLPNGRMHYHKVALANQHDDDNISLCSELSVGRENPNDTRHPHHDTVEDEEILDISDTHSNTSNEDMQHSPINQSVEASINPFTLANTLRFPHPFGLQASASAVAAAATNISPFQEEFLRKSHLYAEELMKHQMQLMAAARASAFSLRSTTLNQLQHHPPQLSNVPNMVHLNPLAKIGQISAAAAAALSAAAQKNKPFTQLHHHQQQHHHHHPHTLQPPSPHYSVTNDTLAKLSALSKQHSPTTTTQMMSTLNQLQTQMQAHLPGLLHDNNDNLHERALKFSIDNILKADFGRSNSLDSPPQIRKNTQHKSSSSCSSAQRHKLNTSSSSSTSNTLLSDPLEHSANSLNHNISPSTQTFSSSLATICTNSNDSSSTAVSSSYSSANGAAGLGKSSPSQTPALSPGFSSAAGESSAGGVNKNASTSSSKSEEGTSTSATGSGSGPIVWPAWVYCTRYSDRPSSGPRVRKPKTKSTSSSSTPTIEKANSPSSSTSTNTNEDKRPRTAFSGSQLARLKHEFNENRYLTEKRRQQLSSELGLNEAQIKIWFQNKRAKLKKSSGVKNPLALQLMAQGLYNHSTIPLTREEEELQELQEREKANNNMPQQPVTSAVSS